MERGGEKMGGWSVQFSLERHLIVGAVWQCSRASIESEFLLLNSIQRYHNLKRLLLPTGFQMKPSERDFLNARSHNCCLTAWDLPKTLFPDNCLHNPSTHPVEVKTSTAGLFTSSGAEQNKNKNKKEKAVRKTWWTQSHPMPWQAIFKQWVFECALEGSGRNLGFN